ncbi:Xaa-Pro peptidase family protein [Marispirochaeta sp.]|uniref:M24 family metallopeptidase n=1 Tax=Marispirochaeta sp. TaxID=2038653 RepID=UPI0029C91069|nr:Xaa-Pro peptidase family protein [Marispirochaeta sp.]
MIPRLTAAGCVHRRAQLLDTVSADLIVLANPRHVYYYSGFLASELTLAGWGPNYLILDREGRSILLVNNSAAGNAGFAFVDEVRSWTWYDAAKNPGKPVWREGGKALAGLLEELSSGMTALLLGIEAGVFPVRTAPDTARLVDISDTIYRQRRVKNEDELEIIRAIVAITGEGHARARKELRSGIREIELYGKIYESIIAAAGEPVNLFCDLISGPRTWAATGQPGSRIIEDGDPVILDLNPYVHGYRADYTSTIVLTEELPEVYQDLEKALHEAIVAGEAILRPGVRAGEVFEAVRAAIDAGGFGRFFDHHAGHGLGLGHPEAPFFVADSSEVLVAGDVVTLEPGAYGEGFGARIEHNYLIGETGPVRLSSHDTSFLI